MSYSDAEMVIASQIAYYDFQDFDHDTADSTSHTVREILEHDRDCGDEGRRQAAINLLEKIDAEGNGTSGCGDWVLKNVRDDNDDSGMYAVMLETGDRQAMVAFRGSESWEDPDQLAKDWIISDVGLLNTTMTPQQREAERYMKALYAEYGNDYDSYGLTGHSLGGNLAQSATVTAPDGMKGKIDQVVSLDGPGFSDEYIAAHYDDIMKVNGKLSHLQWSWCGNLLTQLPGTNNRIVQANTPTDQSCELMNYAWRHDTVNLRYDENGRTIDGDPDELAKAVGPLTRLLDYNTGLSRIFKLFLPGFALIRNLDQVADWLKGFFETIGQAIGNREAARSCSFEFDPLRTAEALATLDACASQLAGIWQTIEEIRGTVRYLQVPVRYRLSLHVRSLKKQQEYTERLSRCGNDCLNHYHSTEAKLSV